MKLKWKTWMFAWSFYLWLLKSYWFSDNCHKHDDKWIWFKNFKLKLQIWNALIIMRFEKINQNDSIFENHRQSQFNSKQFKNDQLIAFACEHNVCSCLEDVFKWFNVCLYRRRLSVKLIRNLRWFNNYVLTNVQFFMNDLRQCMTIF